MKFGYFDDDAKEYVITRPDTPQSWSNYLGSTEYGAIITNNAGGYGFYRSGARGRFLRLCFNSVPMDQPGRYFYLRDVASGDYWSASWQPVGKPLDQYQSICRHGLAYSVFESRYAGIASEATYFVPLGQTFEYWRLKVTNESDRAREISAFTFCEFTNQWDTYQDRVNLQYSLFIVRGELADGLLRIAIQDNLTEDTEGFSIHDIACHAWMALVGESLAGYDTSRDTFLGPYRSYHNPLAVEQGYCTNSNAYGDNACGSLQADLTLQPGESRELLVMLGIGDARSVGRRAVVEYGSLERAGTELQKLQDNVVETVEVEVEKEVTVVETVEVEVTPVVEEDPIALPRNETLYSNGQQWGPVVSQSLTHSNLACIPDRESTMREWMADPRGKVAFGPFYVQTEENSREMFGEGHENAIGMNFMDMMGDMPLVSVLMWQQSALPMHPEDLVDGLLTQVHGQAK